jgi:agmatine deiminase
VNEQTPAAAGYAMPAEWDEHQRCLMSWPTRVELWDGRLDEAKRDYAAVARAIAAFEPLTMVCPPGSEQDVRNHCGSEVDLLVAPIDDSWIRDNGPVFVRDEAGRLAAVNFRFNAWGERWHPYDSDDALPRRVAEYLDVPVFDAPLVLEGGSYFVDGEGTLITTEQCLLNPNRNPDLDRGQIEELLKANLGVSSVVWLPYGHTLDVGPAGTDGHIDGVAQYVAPGRIVLEVPRREDASEYDTSRANLAALDGVLDAQGRVFDVDPLDPGLMDVVAYCNFYLANDAVIVPVIGDSRDDGPLEQLSHIYPDRKIVGVAGEVIAAGGGGPHCITQQVPVGTLGGR